MRFWEAMKYSDEVVIVATAIAAYTAHKDESMLADTILTQIYSAARDAWGEGADTLIDEAKVQAGIVQIIDGLEPLFNGDV